MKYMGSKSRHAKEIIPILMSNHTEDMWYIEPFVGGANMIDKVPCRNKFGLDINVHLIDLYNHVKSGWMPRDDYTEDEYKEIRKEKPIGNPKTAYFGFALSYGGKWFGGWCRDGKGKRDYVKEAYNNAKKQFPLLSDIKFSCRSVFDIQDIPNKATIYCDPPYQGTTKYKDDFNHDRFWEWCRQKAKEGHDVYISEYSAPIDFKCVWQKQVNSSLTMDTGSKKNVEKLFYIG
jgi:DNA adenine methylase